MNGHVLWTEVNIMKVFDELLDCVSGKSGSAKNPTYGDLLNIVQPLLKQAAFNEQRHIIHQLVKTGMSTEEIGYRLHYNPAVVKEIYELDIEEEYEQKYIYGSKLFSYEKR